jgi:hypothetical protein
MIITKLPDTAGEFPVYTDFRKWIEFEINMLKFANNDIERATNIIKALQCVYIDFPEDMEKALNCASEFYRRGKDIKTSGKNCKAVYSFEYDSDYIYAAFVDQYKIDLQDIEYLHWWKFKAMFSGLKSDSKIVEIMGYRAMDIDAKMSSEMKRFYKECKEIYAIPLPKEEKERQDAILQALMKDGDLTGIL